MSSNIGGGRVLKVCDLCGGVDDHPRHIGGHAGGGNANLFPAPSDEAVNKLIDTAPKADVARLLRDFTTTAATEHHYDCGVEMGCEVCTVLAADAKGTGRKMLDHVEAKRAKRAPFADPGIVWAEAE